MAEFHGRVYQKALLKKQFCHFLGGTGDDGKESPGRLIWLGPPLLPIPERPQGNMIAGGKLFLGEPKCSPKRFNAGYWPKLSLPLRS